MKKLTIILIAFAFLSSCKEEETTTPNNNSSSSIDVIGVWNFESLVQENGKIALMGQVLSTYSSESSNETGTFEFKSDGTVTNTVSYTNTMTTTFVGGGPTETTQDIPTTTTTGTYTYDATAKTIDIVTSTSLEQNMEIIEHTATKLVMKYPLSRTTNTGGITSTTSADVITTLSK